MSRCVHEPMDLPFVSCYEEVDYERRLGSIVEARRALAIALLQTGLADVEGVSIRMTSCTSPSTSPDGRRRRMSSIGTGPAIVGSVCLAGTMHNFWPICLR